MLMRLPQPKTERGNETMAFPRIEYTTFRNPDDMFDGRHEIRLFETNGDPDQANWTRIGTAWRVKGGKVRLSASLCNYNAPDNFLWLDNRYASFAFVVDAFRSRVEL